MFKLSKPSQSEIDRFLLRARGQGFSYTEVGSTHGSIPVGYTVDHNRVSLGSGSRIFDDAAAALRTWQMFDLGWVRLFQPNTPIKVGATVVVLIRHFGFWSLNACRVVYLIEEEQRFGFAYGTLRSASSAPVAELGRQAGGACSCEEPHDVTQSCIDRELSHASETVCPRLNGSYEASSPRPEQPRK
ncbi:MAG: hypothetical protein DMG06_22750 [Acidobacteria bacterium]|nr:MAG: hypothetical protein DMG06_22750 [Acidobacteriota bacterium]